MNNNISLDFEIKRPIVFFDLETTGVNYLQDRIIEISVAKLFPDKTSEIKTRRINPERPIPPETTTIHGIKDEDVKNEPTFKAISSSLFKYLENCDLGGYNILRFDLPLLTEEFKRSNIDFKLKDRAIIDVQTVFHKKEPRTLSAAYNFYCGKSLVNAHSSEADILATIEILNGQLMKYPDLPRDTSGLNDFCNPKDPNWIDDSGKFRWSGNEVVVGFGKNEGITLKNIATNSPDFLKWMINASFPDDAKEIAKKALMGEFPKNPL